jgi:hypothetical protein
MMRHTVRLIGLALVTLAALHLFAERADALGAIVIHEEGPCLLPGVASSGALDLRLGTKTADIQKVENLNLLKITCHATVSNYSGRAFNVRNVLVAIKVPSTDGTTTVIATDSHLTISASGEATLHAVFKMPDGPAAGN